MKIQFVTSFSEAGYKLYGERFLNDFIDKFPSSLKLNVFYEKSKPEISNPRILYHDLAKERGLLEFLKRNDEPLKHGVFQKDDGTEFINYRFQATKFVRKVFALTSDRIPICDWLIWIDADVEATQDIPINFFDNLLANRNIALHYLGRKDWPHSECGFVAYNMHFQPQTDEFLTAFRQIYTSDEVFGLPEWHDSYVFDQLRTRIYPKEAMHSLSEGVSGLHVWPKTVLGNFLVHHKGPQAHAALAAAKEPVKQTDVSIVDLMAGCENRYDQLGKLIEAVKPESILEVGTWDGERAKYLLTEALKHQPKVTYYGFDLFEKADETNDTIELNVKPHIEAKRVEATLVEFTKTHGGANFYLIPGNTRQSLPKYFKEHDIKIDFAFIDGGHSIETIQSDYDNLKDRCKLIAFDDFYTAGADTSKFGCNEVIQDIPHVVLPFHDTFEGNGLTIGIAITGALLVPNNPTDGKQQAQVKYDVKSKNCVEDSAIHDNIIYAMSLGQSKIEARIAKLTDELRTLKDMTPVTFLPAACRPHALKGIVVGGSDIIYDDEHPDHAATIAAIKKHRADPNVRLYAVKTSHDILLRHGIVPDGCFLLDPRDHVAAAIDNPDKRVIYFVASMCHPSTFDKLLAAKVKIVGYHAGVHSGEDKVIQEHGGGNIIFGGTTAGLRGLNVLFMLGFRDLEIYGFESSYYKQPIKAHGRNEKPIIQISLNGKDFLTDPELVAQSKDVQVFLEMMRGVKLVAHGTGMLNHAVAIIQARKGVNQKAAEAAVTPYYFAVKNGYGAVQEALWIESTLDVLRARREEISGCLDTLPVFDEVMCK